LKPRNLAVLAAVALLALFAAVDAFRASPPAGAPPAARAPVPAPPGPTSRHVQELMKSDVDLHAVRASRAYCRRDLTVLCVRK
jgi:hypothetical protein